MSKPRYAIVKVNWKCPNKDNKEEIEDIFVCANRKDKREQNHNCSDCLYGDTKEQLVMKVAQVIKRVTNDGYVVAYKKFGTGYINTALNIKDVAKEIVEFLGVE